MKSISIFLLAAVGFSQYSFANIVCSGQNSQNRPIALKISLTGEQDSSGFQLANVSRIYYSVLNPIDGNGLRESAITGCTGVALTGLKKNQMVTDLSNDLYLECDGDGDAGVLLLRRQLAGKFVGTFVAPEGNVELGLGEDEKLRVTCKSK